MKGLLQSKRFKKNLRKWLFMYIGVMALLTSVITYSKYISSFDDGDEAKVPKFNVAIEQIECPASDTECLRTCDPDDTNCTDAYRPTGQRMPFYFTVDSTEIETEADLILTFGLVNKFELVEIEEIVTSTEGETETTTEKKIYDGTTKTCSNGFTCLSKLPEFDTGIDETDLTLSIKRDTIYTSRGKSTFKVIVKYNCKETTDTDNACDLSKVFGTNKELEFTEAVRIGYSVVQRTN